MSNFYDALVNTKVFKKFKVDELLFVEYKCFDEGITTELWTHNNFFSFILNGRMLWKTNNKKYIVHKGETYFVKKGAIKVETFPKENFCDLIVFVPDDFIKGVIEKYKIPCAPEKTRSKIDSVISLESDEVLTSYFESLLAYFAKPEPPSSSLLKLKFEELILNILSSEKKYPVISYFKELFECSKIPVREIMEKNFTSSLSLDEFARLCGRSLSTFKRDFIKIYNEPPGTWLLNKRLDFAKFLLETTNKNIYEIVFESGFKNRSHFIRVFKNKFGTTPFRSKNKLKINISNPRRKSATN